MARIAANDMSFGSELIRVIGGCLRGGCRGFRLAVVGSLLVLVLPATVLDAQPSPLNPQPSPLNPQPSPLNPQPSPLNPQPSTNYVLDLDGTNSYVELPTGIFDHLSTATIEAWVEFGRDSTMRILNYGELNRDLGIGIAGYGGRTLHFFSHDHSGGVHAIEAPGGVTVGRWCHLAAVSGPAGMGLYLNGMLIGTNAFTGSFSQLPSQGINRIGRGPLVPDFLGRIAELRVWRGARSARQIQQDMSAPATGREPGLVGLWNFEGVTNGVVKDLSSGRHNGKLRGNAVVARARFSGQGEVVRSLLLSGKVTDAFGVRQRNAIVRVFQPGRATNTATTDVAGEYRLLFAPLTNRWSVEVVKDDLSLRRAEVRFNPWGNEAMDFTLFEAPSIHGRVLDADGRPRAGAKVELEQGEAHRVVAALLSNSRGEYRFKNLQPASYRLRAAGPAGPVYFENGRAIALAPQTRPTVADLRLPPGPQPRREATPTARRNYVLQLDGTNSYVEVPANLFNNLDAATVEGWVKWRRVGNWMRFFDFGKANQTFYVGNNRTFPDLFVELAASPGRGSFTIIAPGVLETNRWCHIAIVTGPQGARLYLNGVLVGRAEARLSFADVQDGEHNYLGRNNWKVTDPSVDDFDGQMDEVRLWAVARTAAQIQADMFQRLTGREEGLAGLWNFDDPAHPGRDATPNHLDGDPRGAAHVVPAPESTAAEIQPPVVIAGKVQDEKGNLLTGAQVTLEQAGAPSRSATTDSRGRYMLVVPETRESFTLDARRGDLRLYLTNQVARAVGTTMDLTLRQFASLSGKVAGFDKKPLAAIVVQAVGRNLGRVVTVSGFVGRYFKLPDTLTLPRGELPTVPESRPPDLVQTNVFIDFDNLNHRADGFNTRFTDHFFARWTGTVRLERAQNVTFKLSADDAARLWVDGAVVVETDYASGERSGSRYLARGKHSLELSYFQGTGPFSCHLRWEGKDLPPEPDVRSSPFLAAASTDDQGVYRFASLPAGTYQVRVNVPGGFIYATPAPEATPPSHATNQTRVKPAGAEGPSESPDPFVVKDGAETRDVDFQIAPFKKGTWKTYTRADGLPSDQISAICETKDGMMWLGTIGGGVSRWDGRAFVHYSTAVGLHDNLVVQIAADASGGLWFSHAENGVSRWDGTNFTYYCDTNGLPSAQVNGLRLDRAGRFWVATQGGAARWTGHGFKLVQKRDGLPADGVNDVLETRDGRLWFATDGGLAVRAGTHYTTYTTTNGLPANGVGRLLQARDGSIWMLQNLGSYRASALTRFDGTNFTCLTQTDGLPDSPIFALAEDDVGRLWIGTETAGVYCYDGAGFIRYTTDDGLAENRVQTIQTDRDGILWFGTFSGGLSRFDPRGFVRYSVADGLVNNEVLSLLQDDAGRLWIGTSGGVSVWDGRRFHNYTTADGLANDYVAAIASGRSGQLWFGTAGGLSEWDGQRFRTLSQSDGLVASRVTCLYRDAQGLLWVGTAQGLSRWDGRRFENYVKADGLAAGYITAMAEDNRGRLWLGSYGYGVTRWDGTRFQVISHADGGLPYDRVISLLRAGDGAIWLGHDPGGVSRYDGNHFVNYSPADGLAGSFALAILQDRDGALWFGHRREVSLFDGHAWSSFGPEDGLARKETSAVNAFCEARDGSIWIGTDSGVYHHRKSPPLVRRPLLRVTGEREYSGLATLLSMPIGSRVTFDFRFVDRLTPPDRQQFRYQVAPGFPSVQVLKDTTNWSRPTKATSVDWTTNRAGTYTFAVEYLNQDLRYSEPSLATLNLVVPWHQNAAIMVPAACAIAGLFGWAFFARLLYLRKQREAKRLRELLLAEEHRAREAAETAREAIAAKASALAESNRQLASAREAAEAARRSADEANQAKSQFLASMSHELRTPLNAILGYSEMLQEEAEELGDRDYLPDLQKIHTAGKHLLGLINEVLDLSKIEAGKMTLFLEQFDVAKLVREVEATILPLVQKNGNRLEVECPPDLGRMRADVTKVRQVLFNLLSNASKFTEKGTITLRVEKVAGGDGRVTSQRAPSADAPSAPVNPQPSTLNFIISDTGIGMTPEQLSKLFQAFSQADASTSRKYGGTGLGLAISRKFCQLMGGDLTAWSNYGKGTRFTITLPVEVKEPAAAPDPASLATGPAQSSEGAAGPLDSAGTVLVIDDDADVRELIQRHLVKEGYRVETAAGGPAGLERARQLHPDAITLDVMMPGMDGWAVLAALKADPQLATIPVVMVTIVDEKKMGFALGAVEYLTKPIDWERLRQVLRKLGKPAAGQRVLVVEDDAGTRDLLQRNLAKDGWEVAVAANGRLALGQLTGRLPDLILLDLMMPEMDGFEFMEALRARPGCEDLAVIVITAKEITEADRRRLNGQVIEILQKAAHSTTELLAEIRRLLARAQGKSP